MSIARHHNEWLSLLEMSGPAIPTPLSDPTSFFSGARTVVDTVGLNSEMIQKYVRFQEKEEQNQRQLQLESERGGPSKKGRYVDIDQAVRAMRRARMTRAAIQA